MTSPPCSPSSTSSSRRPARRSPSSSARRPTIRWRCTSTTSAPCRCRSPGSRRSRSPTASGAPTMPRDGPVLPIGFQIAGPGLQREPDPAVRLRPRAGDRLRCGRVARGMSEVTKPVIGLEIHVQLSTRTKMFCGCELSFGEPPNTHTCPVCLGLPGSLPVVNARAIHFGLMIGIALGCELRAAVDLPPQELLLSGPARRATRSPSTTSRCVGRAARPTCASTACTSRRTRPSCVHAGASGRIHGSQRSVVDFNRGGTPLVEIVTEPDVRSRRAGARVADAAARDAAPSSASAT